MDLERPGPSDGGVALLCRGLRNTLDGNVSSAWPELAEGSKYSKSKKVYYQDNVLKIKCLADSDQDREMIADLGEGITEIVVDTDRLDGEDRYDHLVMHTKEVESAFQIKCN